MKIESKWTIADELLKEAFDKLEIDEKYYPVFCKRAIRCLNEIAANYEPEQDDIDSCLELSSEYMNIYVGQIEAGLSELWASTYAEYKISCDVDESAHETYNLVRDVQGQDKADEELSVFARFLSDDPRFIESYLEFFGRYMSVKETNEYLSLYDSLIEKGKSAIYAKEYALHRFEEIDPDFCDLYASKYEECVNKGLDEEKAYIIATAYEDLFEEYWPEDDNVLGIEGHKAYITGFEYAIVNDMDSPHYFAREYEKEAIARLFPEATVPPGKVKGKYYDLIKRLYPIK